MYRFWYRIYRIDIRSLTQQTPVWLWGMVYAGLPHPRLQPNCRWRLSPLPVHPVPPPQIAQPNACHTPWDVKRKPWLKWVSRMNFLSFRNCDFGVQCYFSWLCMNSNREIGSSSNPSSKWWVTEPDHSNARPNYSQAMLRPKTGITKKLSDQLQDGPIP